MLTRIYIAATLVMLMFISTFSFAQLRVSQGTYITADNTNIIVEGDFNNSGIVKGTGELVISGSSLQTITGSGAVNNITMDNTSNAVISSANTMNVTGTYTPSSGILTTNGGLILKSDATGTARIGEGSTSGAYISGSVTVERYIPGGRRVFRFLGHPFTSAIALNQFQDDIDVTGKGGTANGFTWSGTNNPSAFWYNTIKGNGSTASDPGWTGYTSAYTNSWARYAGLYILVRGSKGQGLTSQAYTPNPVTIDWSGEINQGTQIVTLTPGDSSAYVFISNPYPSQVDMSAVTRGSSIGENFWAWNSQGGTKGIYISSPFSLSFTLPAYSSFFTTASANTNNTITFYESSKVDSTPRALFKSTAALDIIELKVEDTNGTMWDRLLLLVDNNAVDSIDRKDAIKFMNAETNFYTLTAKHDSLSIDARPYADGKVIPLGFKTTVKKNYSINAAALNMPAGTNLYLHDKYSATLTLLQKNTIYNFSVNNDSLSQGEKRFALNFVPDIKAAITVNPTPTVKNHKANTIYLGYGPQSVLLAVSVTGGIPPYTYSWAQSAGVVNPTATAITVSPKSTTIYTVTITDALGNVKTVTQEINVIDVQCGNKILVCHDGNTLCIPMNAVLAHLQHGCMLGLCSSNKAIIDSIAGVKDEIVVYPNPATDKIKIDLKSFDGGNVKVRIYNIAGQEVLYKTVFVNRNEIIDINLEQLIAGSYVIEVGYHNQLSQYKLTKE